MPSNYGNVYVADLMRDVGNAVDMNYLPEGSGAEHQDIDNAFRDKFDYTSATDINYSQSGSYNTIKSELNNNRPVILSGYNIMNVSWFGLIVEYRQGHEWVCDGYRTVENPCYGTQLFFNMNWGWNGSYNGWYGFADWYISGYNKNFRYYTRAIINIQP